MASSYPGALDALTNPTATDAMNSVTVPHATQHANANDAIEAIETELGVNPSGGSATVVARLDALDTTVSGKAPSTGIAPSAITGTAVVTADSRLSDARTPTAHKTSHESGGSDALTLAVAQVTGAVPIAGAQTAETTPWQVLAVTPYTSGWAPFQIQFNSAANSGAGAGTYNRGMWMGFNASRHSGGSGTTSGKPAIYMAWEDNYYDPAPGDAHYGVEWYVGYVSPNGTGVPVGGLRPFYTRVRSDDNTTKCANTFMEIGDSADASWQVRESDGESLIYAEPSQVVVWRPFTINANSATLRSDSGSGAAFIIDATSYNSAMFFYVAANKSHYLQAESVNSFKVYDKSDRAVVTWTYGASAPVAIAKFGSKVTVDGVLAVGASSTAPTLTATANAGGSPPTPTVTGNSARGVVSFGTGTSPAAGAIITVDIPSGYFGSTPVVTLTAANYTTGNNLKLYVLMNAATQFQICTAAAPAASQAAGTYVVAYQVIG